MRILIENAAYLLPCTGEQKYFKDIHIGIENGRIAFAGATPEKVERFKADRILNGRHRLVMPGLVNAHTHAGMTLLRNSADDLPLEKWLFDRIFPIEARLTEEDIYRGTMLGIAEMLKFGTTAFADMYLHMDAVAQAVCETGIRANLSRSPRDFTSGDHREVLDATEKCAGYFRTWHGKGNGRVRVYVEVHSTYLFDRDSLQGAAQLAKELDTGIHIHLLETEKEKETSRKKYGMSPVEICKETGILDVPVIAAHCVHLTDTDMDLIRQQDVHVIHNPTSNLKLGSGIARIPEMLERGIPVALGTDGAASNNNLNLFEEMHLAALIHKGTLMDPELLGAGQVLHMATVAGAKALGFGESTGCIREGMQADLILLDIDKPHFHPMSDPLSAVVYSAQASDVDTVLVDGAILMEGRELTTIDEEKVKFQVRETAKRIFAGG